MSERNDARKGAQQSAFTAYEQLNSAAETLLKLAEGSPAGLRLAELAGQLQLAQRIALTVSSELRTKPAPQLRAIAGGA